MTHIEFSLVYVFGQGFGIRDHLADHQGLSQEKEVSILPPAKW